MAFIENFRKEMTAKFGESYIKMVSGQIQINLYPLPGDLIQIEAEVE